MRVGERTRALPLVLVSRRSSVRPRTGRLQFWIVIVAWAAIVWLLFVSFVGTREDERGPSSPRPQVVQPAAVRPSR